MRFNRFDPPYDSYSQWKALCSDGYFRVADQSLLSGLLPNGLLAKTHNALLMSSASAGSALTVFVANLNRVDAPASAIDHHPYIMVFDHRTFAASGGFVEHGNWTGRSDLPGPDFFSAIAASGIGAHYPISRMPSASAGLLSELDVDSQNAAFWASFSEMQKFKW
jgi:hypothetical protein